MNGDMTQMMRPYQNYYFIVQLQLCIYESTTYVLYNRFYYPYFIYRTVDLNSI